MSPPDNCSEHTSKVALDSNLSQEKPMKGPFSDLDETSGVLSAAIAHARADGAETSGHAVIIGDRAGIVAWANAAWSRITGIALSETVHKPITHFLEVAEIEFELVDFVGQHFLEGRACMVEFPFETFDQRQIQVQLDVQPIRKAPGELDGFLAVARVLSRSDLSGSVLSLHPTR
jgi:PAS domain S-box-containing protein